MNISKKNLQKILANQIQQHMQNIIHDDQIDVLSGMQEWFKHTQINRHDAAHK
jgi:hypothetical protein